MAHLRNLGRRLVGTNAKSAGESGGTDSLQGFVDLGKQTTGTDQVMRCWLTSAEGVQPWLTEQEHREDGWN